MPGGAWKLKSIHLYVALAIPDVLSPKSYIANMALHILGLVE